ncbi:MAG: diaminopimelate epimerase [Lachnospiraceae bacterium]|nr:diaminopimelate epimerase [Lachnospiraceae bacterium]
MNTITLKKYHGLGNDYLILDPKKNDIKLQDRYIEMMCRRKYGVGADGILYGPFIDGDKISLKIFNSDGSEAEQGGNAISIFARYLKDEGYVTGKSVDVHTTAGIVKVEYLDENGETLKVNMGKASFFAIGNKIETPEEDMKTEPLQFNGDMYNAVCLSIGTPNCVIMTENVSKGCAEELGPYVENADYFPTRINMELMKVVSRDTLSVENYARGEGYVPSSGTGACAAACAAFKMGLTDRVVNVKMPGGDMQIEIAENGDVFMTGHVVAVGEVNLAENFFS